MKTCEFLWWYEQLVTQYGIDIEQEMSDILAKELTDIIDAQIIKDLFNKQNIRKVKIDIIKNKIENAKI